MSTFQHPAFPDVLHRCTDDLDEDALAKGWAPFLDAEQKERLDEIELEVELSPHEPPPPAVRNSSNHPSGLGKFRRETA